MNNVELFSIIETALELNQGVINKHSSSDNIESWDSLGHLSILVLLDKKLKGNASTIKELAIATSVDKIIDLLEKNNLM